MELSGDGMMEEKRKKSMDKTYRHRPADELDSAGA